MAFSGSSIPLKQAEIRRKKHLTFGSGFESVLMRTVMLLVVAEEEQVESRDAPDNVG